MSTWQRAARMLAGASLICAILLGPRGALAQSCSLPCPTGYRCEQHGCVPICAAVCPAGQACVEPGVCGGSDVSAVQAPIAPARPAFVPAPVRIHRAIAKPLARDRQADGGATMSFGVEGAYTFIYYDVAARDYSGGEGGGQIFQATGHMGAVMGTFELEGGFTDAVYLGFRLAAGRIVNSDDSSGVASRYVIGPTLMLRPARAFYIGLDVMAEVLSFDDIAPNIHNYSGRVDTVGGELDGDVLAGLSFGLRFGFVIELSDLIAITPEFRFSSMPILFAHDGASVFFYDQSTGSITADLRSAISASAGFMLATRLFF
jgi:hypothetical protein